MPSSPHWGILWSSEIPTCPCSHTCSPYVHSSSPVLGLPHPCPSSFSNISVTSSSNQVLLSVKVPVQEIPRQATLFSFFMSSQHLGWPIGSCFTILLHFQGGMDEKSLTIQGHTWQWCSRGQCGPCLRHNARERSMYTEGKDNVDLHWEMSRVSHHSNLNFNNLRLSK